MRYSRNVSNSENRVQIAKILMSTYGRSSIRSSLREMHSFFTENRIAVGSKDYDWTDHYMWARGIATGDFN